MIFRSRRLVASFAALGNAATPLPLSLDGCFRCSCSEAGSFEDGVAAAATSKSKVALNTKRKQSYRPNYSQNTSLHPNGGESSKLSRQKKPFTEGVVCPKTLKKYFKLLVKLRCEDRRKQWCLRHNNFQLNQTTWALAQHCADYYAYEKLEEEVANVYPAEEVSGEDVFKLVLDVLAVSGSLHFLYNANDPPRADCGNRGVYFDGGLMDSTSLPQSTQPPGSTTPKLDDALVQKVQDCLLDFFESLRTQGYLISTIYETSRKMGPFDETDAAIDSAAILPPSQTAC